MTNEEMTLEALKLCKKTRIFIPANEYLDVAINSIQENTKLKAEIEQLIKHIDNITIENTNLLIEQYRLEHLIEQLKS